MQVNLVSSAPRSSVGTPPSTSNDAGGGSFANLLDREQAPVEATASQPSAQSAPTQGTQATSDRHSTPRSTRAARAPARAAERTSAHGAAEGAKASDTHEAAAADASTAPGGKADRADGDLAHWLCGLQLPPSIPAPPAAGTASAAGPHARSTQAGASEPLDAAATDAEAPTGRGALRATPGAANGRTPGRDRLEAAADRAASARDLASGGAESNGAAMASSLDAATPRFHETLSALRSGAPEAASAANAPGATATAPAAEAPSSVQVPLAVPLDDPQFPRAFGVQVSVLARDGVQQAELHLNPAEMGPVSVQIVMDGTQARIDFGADAAGTRHLIEHSLPDLAAALREAGLTLAGGGVSQHAGGRDAPGDPASPARGDAARTGRTPGAAADAAARPVRRTVSAGGIDLYA